MLFTFNPIIKRRTENKYKNKEDWKYDEPLSAKCSHFTPPENTRKQNVVQRFQGVQNGDISWQLVKNALWHNLSRKGHFLLGKVIVKYHLFLYL